MPIGLDRGGLDQGKELDTKENNLCENHVFELRGEILMERLCHRTVNLTGTLSNTTPLLLMTLSLS